MAYRSIPFYGLPAPSTGQAKRGKPRSERGIGTVEFALTLPILLMVMIGIVEFGRLMFTYTAVVTAAREASRYGAATGTSTSGVPYYQDCLGIRTRAIAIGSIAGLTNTAASIDIQYDNGPSVDNIAVGCPVGGTGPALSKGDRIIVRVTAQFVPTSGLIPNLPTLTIRSLSRRTVLVSVPLR